MLALFCTWILFANQDLIILIIFMFLRMKTNNTLIVTNLLTENEATTQYCDEEAETKDELEMCLINRTLEYLQEFQFLHPPVTQTLRNSYLLTFQKRFLPLSSETPAMFWKFVNSLLQQPKRTYASNVLDFVVDVMQKDIEFWSKHKKRKAGDENFPLVKHLFNITKTTYNEENLETVLNFFMIFIKVPFTNCSEIFME